MKCPIGDCSSKPRTENGLIRHLIKMHHKGELATLIMSEKMLKPLVFVSHIERHLKASGNIVMCKFCNKTIDEIFKEAFKNG